MANKTYNIVKMHFTTPLHLSRGQTESYDRSEEVLHSDTIKSAVFVAAKMLFGSEINEDFFDSFKVSSAFPFKENEYFFPKPMAPLSLKFVNSEKENEESKEAKKFKKINFISQTIFQKIISGTQDIEVKEKQFSSNGKFVFAAEIKDDEDKIVYKSEVQQRLAMPRPEKNKDGNWVMEEDGTPYYIDRVYFTEGSGLYFFIEYLPNSDKNKIEAAIRLLGDEGVGTDKHIGNGLFEPEFDTLKLDLPENANSQMLLSLYLPEKEELGENLKQSSYQLIKRGGYIASPENMDFLTFRKKSVYMFLEASIFPKEMILKGKKEDLKPEKKVEHSVWRDGKAFSIPYLKV